MRGPEAPPPPELVWSWWCEGKRQDVTDLHAARAAAEQGRGYIWVGLHKPSEQTMVRLGLELGIHPLVIEDAVHGHRRSKLERYDDDLFMVASTVSYQERVEEVSEIVNTGELMIVLGPHWVLTSRHSGASRMQEVKAEVEAAGGDMPDGPWRVLHACLSVAIADFAKVVVQMEEDVEEAEETVFADVSPEIERPYQIKRELIEFRRTVAPLCAPVSQLAVRDFTAIPAAARPYFRELSDTVQEIRENVVAMEDQLTNILQAALARASVADNRDMRKISAAVAIVAVPTTLGAIYGMNFDFMPELHWEFGYFGVMLINAVMMVTLYVLFRRFKWL